MALEAERKFQNSFFIIVEWLSIYLWVLSITQEHKSFKALIKMYVLVWKIKANDISKKKPKYFIIQIFWILF